MISKRRGRTAAVAAVLAAVSTMAACTSSGGARGGAGPSSPAASPTAARTYATAADAVAAACVAFDRFTADLARLTPHGSQITLEADAAAAYAALGSTTAPFDAAASKLSDDVDALVTHVSAQSWPDQGTPLDPQITAVADDCAGRS